MAITLTGCKENVLINSKISPADNTIGVFSVSLPVITHTYFDDSANTGITFSGIPVYQALGTITDPFFGTMTASTYFNLLPSNPTTALYDNCTVDSAFLVLPYSGFTYGDSANTSATQTYQVFYMNDTIGYTTTYYGFSSKPIDANAPLTDPFTINVHSLTDSIQIDTAKYHPGLRVKLKQSVLMPHIMSALANCMSATSPTLAFLNYFNGVCIRVADTRSTGVAIPYFQLNGSDMYSHAGILVYFHNNSAPTTAIVEQYYFSPDASSHFNSIQKSYSHYPVNNLLHSTAANDDIVALQNTPGASIDVVIPGISSLPAGIISKAELMLTLLPGNDYNPAIFASAEKVYGIGIGTSTYPSGVTAGESYILSDRYPISSTSAFNILDGYSHSFTVNGTNVTTYTLGIPREIMNAIAQKSDTVHLHISGTTDYYGGFHMVAGGGNHSDTVYRAKLKVVYSKLNQ